jgi:septum formation protein
MKLILASSSPRRVEILRNAGFAFNLFPTGVDETRLANENAEDYVRRVANAKAGTAEATAKKGHPAIVIGADTIVALGNRVLGKPSSVEEARWMLRLLSGRTHQVFTGLALVSTAERQHQKTSHVEMTKVTFVELSEAEIEDYLESGEPLDKAGAYGIQGIGGRYVTRIEGCYFNVMGLPLSRLSSALRTLGWRESDTE